jgi:ATP-dependent Clp protease protease subunit
VSTADAGLLGGPLFERRVVNLWGPLDDAATNRACAEMMALDATGSSAVHLYVASSGGPLHCAMAVIDTMDLLGVPVEVTCLGLVQGSAVGVAAAGSRRAAAPHAQFHLCAPQLSADGTAAQLASWAEHHQAAQDLYLERLSRATGRPLEHLEADMALGRWFAADEALLYGLVDEIWAPGRRPGLPS